MWPASDPEECNKPSGAASPRLWADSVSNPFFSEEFSSGFDAMPGVLDRVIDALLRDAWIEAAGEPHTRLCIEEALVNAVRHGNESDPARKVRL